MAGMLPEEARARAAHPDATLADVGEFGLVERLLALFPAGERVLLGPGDDAAVVAVPDGRVVVSTDLLVEGRHFRRGWSTALDVGHKAAAQNLSDVNAMGGTGSALTVGLAAPPDLPVAWALDLARGMAEECAAVDARVVGGDLTAADQVVVAVTVLGTVDGAPVLRSGASPGDVVAVAGRLGWAAAGLAVLGRGFGSPRAVVDAHRRPRPPYDAGPAARAAGATAMVDVSDGLVADLGHVARASGVQVDLDSAALAPDEPVQAVGAALGVDPTGFVLTGGEDHALAATFPPSAGLPGGWRAVGRVVPLPGPDAAPVTVAGAAYEGPGGHAHFR
jgi:thiamine-monophosphate kinase